MVFMKLIRCRRNKPGKLYQPGFVNSSSQGYLELAGTGFEGDKKWILEVTLHSVPQFSLWKQLVQSICNNFGLATSKEEAVRRAIGDSGPYVQCQAIRTLPQLSAAVANGSSRSRLQELQGRLHQQEPLRPDSSGMAQRPPFIPRVVWLSDTSEDEDEEEKGAEAAPPLQHEEVQELQLLQADPNWELPEEEKQEYTHVMHNPRAKLFWETISLKVCEGSTVELAEAMTEGQSCDVEAGAALLDTLVESEVSTLKQVPRIVRCIHRWFTTNTDESAEHRLDDTLVELTDAHPHDVVVALLRCAPSCDRAAAAMWRMMVTTSMTAKKVFQELLCVLEDWPLHRTSTSDGDQQDVLALAATRVLWEILRMPMYPRGLKVNFPRLLLALLFQVSYSTEQMSDEVDTFWRECQEEGGLPTSPSRFIVLTVKALLCRLGYRLVAFEVERRHGWDMLLHAETHHCAMGLLAREIHDVSRHFNASVVSYLVELLSKNEPRCVLPAMAFLVEILASPGRNVRVDSFLQLVPRYLESDCRITRSLVLKGLSVLCGTPRMVPKMRFLVRRLTDVLQDTDMDVVKITLSVLRKVIRDPRFPISTPIALQLAERLRPLFDNESGYMQQLSVSIFKEVIERVDDGKKPLKTLVHQSLLPLIFHVHDENKSVAATCRATLLQATLFLKKEKLRQAVLRDQQIEAIGECLPAAGWVLWVSWQGRPVLGAGTTQPRSESAPALVSISCRSLQLAECHSRAAEYLLQSLTYMESPQDSIREAAVAFLGVLGQHMRAQPEKFQLIYEAVQRAIGDSDPYVQRQAIRTLPQLRAAVANGSSRSRLQELQGRLHQVWRRRRPSLWGNGWLCCWGSAQD
ncbi:maestro heat-like repeat-containing protein family member 6 [Patagioenas fasciata]|uniref:maestro heat-like repeat-containing protein family member 6 n=1 Tax=Patagioenas fasciata TaxID=372321 RepID=UPI003A98EAD6